MIEKMTEGFEIDAGNALSKGQPVHGRHASAWMDIVEGIARWRLWGRLGWNDILQRYRRSVLGPFWLTASTALMVVALGVIYAELFNQSVNDFLPFFCVGLLVWNLIASYLTEGGTLFTGSESYIKQISLPYSVYVYRSSWAKLIIFAHNFIIYIGVLIYFQIWPGSVALLAIPGLMIVALNGTIASLTIGIVSARFRDIPQVITSVVQILFFLTPIFWKPESLRGHAYVTDLNPFYHLLEIVRAPLLGNFPTAANYFGVLLVTLINAAIAGAFFSRFRSRIAYWI
jgi:homopolymeric O-antigen transport system permease protein